MVVQDEGAYCPDDTIEEGDEGDDEQGGEGDVAEIGSLDVPVVQVGEDAGFDSFVAGLDGGMRR